MKERVVEPLRAVSFACVVGLLLAPVSVSRADRIRMTNGKAIECAVVSEDDSTVQARTTAGALLVLPRSQIASIERSGGQENRVRAAESLFEARRYPQALEAYARALSDAPEELAARERKV